MTDLIEELRQDVAKEAEFEGRLRRDPNLAEKLLPELHKVYRHRVGIIRKLYGCGIDRDRWQLLRGALLEETELLNILAKERDDSKKTALVSQLEETIKRRGSYLKDFEAAVVPDVECPQLDEETTLSQLTERVREQAEQFIKGSEKAKKLDLKDLAILSASEGFL